MSLPPHRLATAVAVSVLVTVTAACGGSAGTDDAATGAAEASADPDDAADPGDAADAAPVDLRVTTWTANEDHLALLDSIAESYRSDDPDAPEITFESLPFEGYTTAVTTQIAGGNPPDIVWILERDGPDFVQSGALFDLAPVMAATDGYEPDDISPNALAPWADGEQVFAYPFSTSPVGVFYNVDQLTAAAAPLPRDLIAEDEWTWENALAAASAAAAETGNEGLVVRAFDYQDWGTLSSIWTGWGAEPWSEDGATCTMDAPEMVEAMSVIHEAIFEQGALPSPGVSADFFAGQSAMTLAQISQAALLAEADFEWDFVPLPAGPAGDTPVFGQAAMGVLAASENADAAAEFLVYLTNPENSAQLARFFPPARSSQLDAEVLGEANPLLTPEQLEAVVVDGVDRGVVRPVHTDWAAVDQSVRASLDALWQPDADVEAVLGDVCDSLDPVLR